MLYNKDDSVKIYDELFNAGPPLKILAEQFITPNNLFFTRNHGQLPEIDETSFRLQIQGKVGKPSVFSLAELQANFTEHTIAATLQCAGNRRDDMVAYSPIDDQLGWGAEAIGNAEWTGVALADVLQYADVDENAKHIEFLGLDEVINHGEPFQYGSSIPLPKALKKEVLLAYKMNGEPLPTVHGGPLRVIVPGYIGARSVKWVHQITVQDEPSANYFQQKAYKLLLAPEAGEEIDYTQGFMLGELSVNSVIASPSNNVQLPAGELTVKGYSIAGGGRAISRVDISVDGGEKWKLATLGTENCWSWRLWETTFQLESGTHELVVRAWDDSANTQPNSMSQVWNIKGYMSNAWHRVKLSVE